MITAEEELKKYKLIYEYVNDPIFIITPDGGILEANRSAQIKYGYSSAELRSMNISDLMTPEQKQIVREHLARCMIRECKFSTVHRRKDGAPFPVEVKAVGTRCNGQHIIVAVVTDMSEKMQAEEIRSRLAAIVEHSHDALLNVSPDGTILVWNKGAELIYGYTRQQAIGKHISMLFPKEKMTRLKQIIDTVMAGNTIDNPEDVRKRKDGKLVEVSVILSPIKDSSGKVVAISWAARDVSEMRRAERALRDSEERFKAIFEQAAIGIAQISPDGRFIKVNKRFHDILGYTLEEMYQLKINDVTYPADRDYVLTYLRRLIAGEIPTYTIEKRSVRKDGSIIWVSTTVSPVKDGGQPKYFVFIVEDISERKAAEDALRYSEERFRAVYDWAGIGIAMADKNGILIDVNNKFLEILGFAREDLIHRSINEITCPEDVKKCTAYFNRIVTGGIDHYRIESRYMHKEGGLVWTRLTTSAVRNLKGELSFAIIMAEDISEIKRAEEGLIDAKSQAELYLDIMGHDINNLNQIALGYLELAIDSINLQADEKQLLERSVLALNNSTNIISNVKKLKAAREKEYRFEIISVNDALLEMIDEYQYMAGKDFTINYSPSASCKVKANSLLKDVFGNIIGNSVKHSGRAVTIDVRTDVVTENMTEYCRVIIEDDGPGIPDARKCDIFNRVSRLARGTKSIGLGLHIVKSLIEDYDGYVWAEDRVHGDHTRGARFVVMLPIAGK